MQTLATKPKDYLWVDDIHEIRTGCTSSDQQTEMVESEL